MKIDEAGLKLLKERVARLQRLIDLNANMHILASEICLVEAAGWMTSSEAMGQAKASHIGGLYRQAKGFCSECDEFFQPPDRFCKACNDRIDVEEVMEQ